MKVKESQCVTKRSEDVCDLENKGTFIWNEMVNTLQGKVCSDVDMKELEIL